MADTKVSGLTALAGVDVAPTTDVLPIVDTSVTTTKKITVDELDKGMFGTAKGWVVFDSGGNISASSNVTSVVRNSSGTFTITWAADFSSTAYAVFVTAGSDSGGTTATAYVGQAESTGKTATAVVVKTLRISDGAPIDTTYCSVVAFGDQ